MSAIPSSVTWTQVSGLKLLVEPFLKQTLEFLPRPDVWNALGPVPSACLLFLGAYYQAWSQQVSAAFLCLNHTHFVLAYSTFPLLLYWHLSYLSPLCGFGCRCVDVVLSGIQSLTHDRQLLLY